MESFNCKICNDRVVTNDNELIIPQLCRDCKTKEDNKKKGGK